MISLIGLPFVGKSTVGRKLAAEWGRPFIDLDVAIEQKLGCTIAEYFAAQGEEAFRSVESDMIARLCAIDRCILSTGGGSVLRPANRSTLRARGTVIYLYAEPQQLYARLKNDGKRPLLQVQDPHARLHELYAGRDPLYRETADYVIQAGGRPSRFVVRDIFAQLGVAP